MNPTITDVVFSQDPRSPAASDVTNPYTLEKNGSGTKLNLAMGIVILTPGMEDFVKNQVKSGPDTSMNAI